MNRRRFIGMAALGLFGLTRGKLSAFPEPVAAAAPSLPLSTGTFLFLDGGTLDLGVFRDTLVPGPRNDFRIFAETFENVAQIGQEPIAVGSSAQ